MGISWSSSKEEALGTVDTNVQDLDNYYYFRVPIKITENIQTSHRICFARGIGKTEKNNKNRSMNQMTIWLVKKIGETEGTPAYEILYSYTPCLTVSVAKPGQNYFKHPDVSGLENDGIKYFKKNNTLTIKDNLGLQKLLTDTKDKNGLPKELEFLRVKTTWVGFGKASKGGKTQKNKGMHIKSKKNKTNKNQ